MDGCKPRVVWTARMAVYVCLHSTLGRWLMAAGLLVAPHGHSWFHLPASAIDAQVVAVSTHTECMACGVQQEGVYSRSVAVRVYRRQQRPTRHSSVLLLQLVFTGRRCCSCCVKDTCRSPAAAQQPGAPPCACGPGLLLQCKPA
jgi:hypothetical protein